MFALFGGKRENEDKIDFDGKLITLPINSVSPNPNQPRRNFDPHALQELSNSIVEHGLMQPIVVRLAGDKYELIAGERRWRACCLAGLEEIEAYVIKADSEQSACMALVENLHREDLHFFEVAESYSALMSLYCMTQEQLAKRIGKKQSTVANKLRVARMPQSIKEAIVDHGLTERHARSLLKIVGEEDQLKIIDEIVKKSLSVKGTEELIEEFIKNDDAPQKPKILRIFKDYRLYVNTVKSAVKQLQVSGVDATYDMVENEDNIVISVNIPKVQK